MIIQLESIKILILINLSLPISLFKDNKFCETKPSNINNYSNYFNQISILLTNTMLSQLDGNSSLIKARKMENLCKL